MARPLDLARQWREEGLLSAKALEVLERRYGGQDATASNLSLVLLFAAGIVLAAAVIAYPVFLEADATAAAAIALAGAGVAATAAVPWWSLVPRQRSYAEALGVTAIALATFGGALFVEETRVPAAFVLIALAGILWLPQTSWLVPTSALIGFGALLPATFEGSVAAANAWSLAVALQIGLLAASRFKGPGIGWRHEGARALAPLLVVVTGVWFFFDFLQWDFTAAPEAWVAILGMASIGAGWLVRDGLTVMTSVVIVAADAVVFGFDVGDVVLGIPLLLIVAAALVALAIRAQQRGGILPS